MKISKLFHYLYACIMFLPLLVIPIFAINIINRSPEPISVTVDDTETTLDIQYKYESNEVNTKDDLVIGNLYKVMFDASLDNYFNFNNGFRLIFNIVNVNYFDFSEFADLDYFFNQMSMDFGSIYYPNTIQFYIDGDNILYLDFYYSLNSDYWFEFVIGDVVDQGLYFYFEGVLVDYAFNSLGDTSIYYTDYNVIESAELVTTGTTTTYNDTDIGSQFVYSVYSVTDKYFNVTDLFGFDALQQWFIVNIFHGSVNLGFYIFWNLLTYWLFASIFWLIFDVVIYVPQLVHRWLDKGVIE